MGGSTAKKPGDDAGSIQTDGGIRKRWFSRKTKAVPKKESKQKNAPASQPPQPKGILKNKKNGGNSTLTTRSAATFSASTNGGMPRNSKPKPKPASQQQPALSQQQSSSSNPNKKPSSSSSWFCRTAYFEKLCNAAFDLVDNDGSGTVDDKELYSGLLLIHLKLGTYAGPAACRPLSRERCQAVFRKMDADHSGSLDREEFRHVMVVLFSNVLFRVAVQWSMTLMIVPVVARALLDGFVYAVAAAMNWIATRDEHHVWADKLELALEWVWAKAVALSPDIVVRSVSGLYGYLALVPEAVWQALPLTILSTVLGILVVPWCIFQVDDFFQAIADRRAVKAAAAAANTDAGRWI